MTKQLTRQEVEAVVEMLQEKDECMDPRYCVVCKRRRNTQITIGHTLSRIDKTVGGRNYYIGQTTYNDELIHLWSRCGELTQSLQEIIEESGWEKEWVKSSLMNVDYLNVLLHDKDGFGECVVCSCNMYHLGDCSIAIKRREKNYVYHLTSPEANALFSFLLQIGL